MLAAFLSVLLLAGCAGGKLAGGDQPVAVAAAPVAAPAAPNPPPPSSSGGARGGSTTARRAPVEDPDAPTPTGDPVIQARADCWMAVEHRHELRGIDQRITFVDKCVAEKTKGR
jgi:hypothetical protein